MSRCDKVFDDGSECRKRSVGSVMVRPNSLSNWKPFDYCEEHCCALRMDLVEMGWDVQS